MKRRKVVIVPTLTLKAVTTCGRFIPQKVLIAITAHQQKKRTQSRGYIIRWKKLKSVPMWEWQEKRCF